MDDKNLMEDLLDLEKGVCDLYLHGTVEAATPEVQQRFHTALSESLSMQSRIYSEMSGKGWYAPDCAEQQKVQQVRDKFCASC